jgi:putative NADPH-quinone reductase
MSKRRILLLDGHPDPSDERFVHALAAAYRGGAEQGKHEVRYIRVADLEFPLLRTQADYETGRPVAAIRSCQSALEWANHVVIIYPLWLGSMPALLKALLEQALRPGFAFSTAALGYRPLKLLGDKTAHIIVTTGMPGLIYRWYFRAHSVRSLERNVLRYIGFRRVRSTVIGNVAGMSSDRRATWLDRMRILGHQGR